jgi:MFS transporter, PPP family, 3-phenylpropionic acid transporter
MVFLGLLMAAVMPLLVISRSFPLAALALAVLAIGYKGAVPVSDALVSRILAGNRTNYGRIRVFGSIGFVCMALLLQFTALVDPSSPRSIALWIAIPALLFSLSVALIPGLLRVWPRQDDASGAEKTAVPVGKSGRISSVLGVFSSTYWAGIALIFLGFLGLTPSQRFFSLYVQDFLGLESYAGLWALAAAAEVPFMFLSGKFIRRYGTERIILVSLAAIALRNLVYAAFPTFGGAVAGQLFHSVCFGLFHPAAVVFVADRAPKRFMAVAMALYTSVSVGLASVLGNVAGGFVIDRLGYCALFVIFSAFPVMGMLLYAAFRRRG